MEWYYVVLIVLVSILLLIWLSLEIFSLHGYCVMKKKGKEAQICYEDLKKRTGIDLPTNVEFLLNKKRAKQMLKACFKNNPFPRYRIVLLYLRLKAVVRLYKKENLLQTGPAAACLSLAAAQAEDIYCMRNKQEKVESIETDVAYAGLQVIRLYMMAYEGSEDFRNARFASALMVDNALNGSFYKYECKDHTFYSAHVYYENQKVKLMKALKIKTLPADYNLDNLKKDRKEVANVVKAYNGTDIEELSFECGASGCVLRDRSEWDKTEVGKAVNQMPLFRINKVGDAPKKKYGKTTGKGPLSGVKVLDLTHIIAGPAASRVLGEYGADVLLVRRGKFVAQEQAMLELDGWASKNSIQLDFNIPEHLEKCKKLIAEADVIVYSYQNHVLDKFGLSKEDIHKINPNIIYGSLMCFSDSVWADRPGWAPLAEDITGLSIRNGSRKKPKNLNGVPLDYIPGFILANGILDAIRLSMKEGGAYDVTGSLSRTAVWLHECTDICKIKGNEVNLTSSITSKKTKKLWDDVLQTIPGCSVGTVKFPTPATYVSYFNDLKQNMKFVDGNSDWVK